MAGTETGTDAPDDTSTSESTGLFSGITNGINNGTLLPAAAGATVVVAKTGGRVATSLVKTSAKTLQTVSQLSQKLTFAETKAAQSLARAEGSSGFMGWFAQRAASSDARNVAKLTGKVTEAEVTAARVAGVESTVGSASKWLGRAGWLATAAFAAADIYKGYKRDGLKGAVSAAADTATVLVPSMIAADWGAGIGAAIGTAIFPGVGTVVGGAIGGIAAGWFAGSAAEKYALPIVHQIGSGLASLLPDTSNGDQTSTNNGDQTTNPAPVVTPQGDASTTTLPAPDPVAAAKNGVALFSADSASFTPDQRAALVASERFAVRQMIQAEKTRSHAKILLGGEIQDFDGTAGPDATVRVVSAGHTDVESTFTSAKNLSRQEARAQENADAFLEAARAEGLKVDVKVKADGVGKGDTFDQKRNATLKLVGASM